MSKIITYDLCQPGQNYEDLISAIKEYSKWARVTESTWIIVTDDSCETIRNNLVQHIDTNDRLFVAKLSGEAAWRNVKCKNDWLKENL